MSSFKGRNSTPTESAGNISGSCHICTGKDQVWKHKHWSLYDGELAAHLQENGYAEDRIPPILHWAHTNRSTYGGMVDEHGASLSAWEARRAQLAQYEKTYTRPPEPRAALGRKLTFRALTHLLTGAHSAHAAAWLEMLNAQFSETALADEGTWSDFLRFLGEYERSSADPNNAAFLDRLDMRPVVAMAGATR